LHALLQQARGRLLLQLHAPALTAACHCLLPAAAAAARALAQARRVRAGGGQFIGSRVHG